MKITKIISICCGILLASSLSSCGSSKFMAKHYEVNLSNANMITPEPSYQGLDKTIGLKVYSTVTPEEMYDDQIISGSLRKVAPKYTFAPEISVFAQAATQRYMQGMGFQVQAGSDYQLVIEVKQLQISLVDENSATASARLAYKVVNEANETVLPLTSVSSRVNLQLNEETGKQNAFLKLKAIMITQEETFASGICSAYAKALDKIDWDEIAALLKSKKLAKKEATRQVKGNGNTALEHTVIRWYIDSKPKGADVYWRVVSSTPEVSNTNTKYVGTTPYESTESFDVKGLSYDNSGNVQIEVSCERDGYLTQKKRFNLRQVIDQKEISAKFNLVKDDE